jgi:predicted enzyme related to lactoylglutathione lyase
MHKSRLAGFIIDCQTDDLVGAANFWGSALGLPVEKLPPGEEAYRRLDTGPTGLHIEVQQVSHPSRVHLDIEADDIEAEAARLEKLGARRIQKIHTWLVMEAPTGQRFCIVRPQSADFAQHANVWPSSV